MPEKLQANTENDGTQHSLVGAGIKVTLRYLLAFLLSNKLLGYRPLIGKAVMTIPSCGPFTMLVGSSDQ